MKFVKESKETKDKWDYWLKCTSIEWQAVARSTLTAMIAIKVIIVMRFNCLINMESGENRATWIREKTTQMGKKRKKIPE